MMNQYVLCSRLDTHDTILELWGASTKHPDCLFKFSNFKLSEWFPKDRQIFQWILECASKLDFPIHARELVDFALDVWDASMQMPRD